MIFDFYGIRSIVGSTPWPARRYLGTPVGQCNLSYYSLTCSLEPHDFDSHGVGSASSGGGVGSTTTTTSAAAQRPNDLSFCILWSPLPPITYILPFIGHMGIADSKVSLPTFRGPTASVIGGGWRLANRRGLSVWTYRLLFLVVIILPRGKSGTRRSNLPTRSIGDGCTTYAVTIVTRMWHMH